MTGPVEYLAAPTYWACTRAECPEVGIPKECAFALPVDEPVFCGECQHQCARTDPPA